MVRIPPARAVVGAISVPGDRWISHHSLLVGAISEGETELAGFGRSRATETTLAAVRELGVDVDEEEVDRLRVHGRGVRGFDVLRVIGAEAVEPGEHETPFASPETKEALLLAGVSAKAGSTTVREPVPTRDHLELLLSDAGALVTRTPRMVRVEPAERLQLARVEVPGDFSAATPFIVAATMLSESHLYLQGVGFNPTRAVLLDVLERMGARITVFNRRRAGREPVGDIEVRSAPLTATTISREEVAVLVDELSLVLLAAGSARGETVVRGAGELREWINSVSEALRPLGIRARPRHDGVVVAGVPTRPKGGGVASGGDDRLAILGAVAGLVSKDGTEVEGAEAAAISFPGFFELLDSVSKR